VTPADRLVIASPAARLARQRLAPVLLALHPQLETIRPAIPSYVTQALDALLAQLHTWERDEREIDHVH
jgi:hypothetical protein